MLSCSAPLPFVSTAAIDVTQDADWIDSIVLVNGDPGLVADHWIGPFDPAKTYQDSDAILSAGLFWRAIGSPAVAVTPAAGPSWAPVMTLTRDQLGTVDLSGGVLDMVIVPSESFATPIAAFSSGASGFLAVTDAVNGTATWSVPKGVVAGWPCGEWRYVLRLHQAGSYFDVLRGVFRIFPRAF